MIRSLYCSSLAIDWRWVVLPRAKVGMLELRPLCLKGKTYSLCYGPALGLLDFEDSFFRMKLIKNFDFFSANLVIAIVL